MNREIKIGDIVARKSYGRDILFKVIALDPNNNESVLKGVDWRLIADAPIDDLEVIEEDEIHRIRNTLYQQEENTIGLIVHQRNLMRERENRYLEKPRYLEQPGRVFHIDGDPQYLKLCLEQYEKLGIPAAGVHMEEKDIPKHVVHLLEEYQPDILVVTGHDAFKVRSGNWSDINNYRNSKYFIEAVKNIRKNYERHRDNLIIFAGACQSFYEGIIRAGANFASAPQRVNIHALDPVYVAEKAAFTSIRETVPLVEMIGNTLSGKSGIGGIESRGTFRLGFPTEKKNKEIF